MLKSLSCLGLVICLLLSFGAIAEETQTLESYLEGYAPMFLTVVAYEPANPSGQRVNFDAVPMEDNAGDVSNPDSNLTIAQKLFDSLQYTETEDSYGLCTDDHWHFAIEYEVNSESDDSMMRKIRLDFYDYSENIHISISDSSSSEPIYESYIQIPLQDSYAFEDIYLKVVAMLRRAPSEQR